MLHLNDDDDDDNVDGKRGLARFDNQNIFDFVLADNRTAIEKKLKYMTAQSKAPFRCHVMSCHVNSSVRSCWARLGSGRDGSNVPGLVWG